MKNICVVVLAVILVLNLSAAVAVYTGKTGKIITPETANRSTEPIRDAQTLENPPEYDMRQNEPKERFLSEFFDDECIKRLNIDVPELEAEKFLLLDIKKTHCADKTTGTVTNCTVYLFFRDILDFSFSSINSFLLVERETNTERKLDFEILDYCIFGMEMYVNDIDGDRQDEIIIQQMVDLMGGAGQYRTMVYKIEDEGLREIFVTPSDEGLFDTGFESELLSGYKIRIYNTLTGFAKTIDHADPNGWYFDSEGEPIVLEDWLWVDSFHTVEVKDFDNDGIFELITRQYVCWDCHAFGIGDAVSVLKFNSESQKFEVIHADFEPYDYEF